MSVHDIENFSRESTSISFETKFKIQNSNSESAPPCAMIPFPSLFPGFSVLPRFQVTVSNQSPLLLRPDVGSYTTSLLALASGLPLLLFVLVLQFKSYMSNITQSFRNMEPT